MSNSTDSAPPGWYQAEGDPPDTIRFWDGRIWSDDIEPDPKSYLDDAPMTRDVAVQMNPAAANLFDAHNSCYRGLTDWKRRATDELSAIGYYLRAMTSRYADASHRARRGEFGVYVCVQFGVVIMTLIFALAVTMNSSEEAIDRAVSFWFVGLLVLVTPTVTVIIRRLHDLNRAGGWALLLLVPWLNVAVFLYLLLANSKRDTNQWGQCPK